MEERHPWLIWVTFDLAHQVWPVSHEPYFNLQKPGSQEIFVTFIWAHKLALKYTGIHCLQFCVNILSKFEGFYGIATVWKCDEYIAFSRDFVVHGCQLDATSLASLIDPCYGWHSSPKIRVWDDGEALLGHSLWHRHTHFCPDLFYLPMPLLSCNTVGLIKFPAYQPNVSHEFNVCIPHEW